MLDSEDPGMALRRAYEAVRDRLALLITVCLFYGLQIFSLVGSFSPLLIVNGQEVLSTSSLGTFASYFKNEFPDHFPSSRESENLTKRCKAEWIKKKKEPRGRNSQPELDKEGLAFKGQSQHKLYFTLLIFLARNYTWKKKKNLHLFKGSEKIPMGSVFLSLFRSFLRLTLIQERLIDIIRAHMFLLLEKTDVLHPSIKTGNQFWQM